MNLGLIVYFFIKIYNSKIDINKINKSIYIYVCEYNMIFFRTIINLIFLLASVNLMASDQKPSILIFVLDKNENNQP